MIVIRNKNTRMQFFAVFAAVMAVACGAPNSWTMNQLSDAIQNPHTNPAYLPYLEEALNEMVAAIFAGQQVETTTVAIPSVNLGSMTLAQVSQALENPETDPALVPYLEVALNQMMENLMAGSAPVSVVAATAITVPPMEVSFWTLSELSEALQNPSTSSDLVPYLENALNQIMETLVVGEQMDFIVIATPAGIIPAAVEATPVIVVPSPVDVAPVNPTPVVVAPVNPTPVVVAPVSPVATVPATPAAASSPLVQIIINIKQQEEVASVLPTPVAVSQPALIPEPINIVEQPLVTPEAVTIVESAPVAVEPVTIVDNAPIAPEAVIVVEQAPIAPEAVIVVEQAPIAPESVSVVMPNPIDVIAVMPPSVGSPVNVVSPSVVGPI